MKKFLFVVYIFLSLVTHYANGYSQKELAFAERMKHNIIKVKDAFDAFFDADNSATYEDFIVFEKEVDLLHSGVMEMKKEMTG